MNKPTWTTPAGFLFTATELSATSTSVIATGTPTYTVISGALPVGLTLSSTGTIFGSPSAVLDKTRSTFVIRAANAQGVADRTFNADVVGADNPIWSTTAGYLPVGVQNELFALNNQWVDYNLAATPNQAPGNTELKYYIANGNGTLPPGLTLETNGRIRGFLKDQLSFSSGISDTGGYDSESYDNYSYDHAASFIGSATDTTIAGLPKIYQFRVTATDGIGSSTRLFKIVVTNVTILKYNSTSMPIDLVLPINTTYIQYPQWLKDSDLGTIRANNNEDINISAYDPSPLVGPLVYTIINDVDIYHSLPQGLQLDQTQGIIYGFVPYQPAYTRNYTLDIQATKFDLQTGLSISTTNTYTLAVKGEVESTIQWVSSSDLGSIDTGITSEVSVIAEQIQSEYSIKYEQVSGTLPPGLTLARDGSLTGKVTYGSTGTYTFTILASDVYDLSSIEKTFSLTVTESDQKEYTEIYVRPFLSKEKRESYREFINNDFTFPPELMYRFYDPNFGVQPDIKIVLEFGIEKIKLGEYVGALRENFYRRKFYFGDLKVAVAKNSQGTSTYEIVYVDVVDDMVNNNNVSASRAVYTNNDIYYPGSIDNMRLQLQSLVLEDYTSISVNTYNQPRFMLTPQAGYYKPTDYIRVIPICYALPGQGSRIISRIKLSNFDFKMLDFEIDRLIVQSSEDNSTAKYLILDRQALGDSLATDRLLYGAEQFTPIEDENSNNIIRE